MTAIRRVLLGVLMLLSYSACAEPLSLLSRAADSSVALTLTAAQRQWLHQNAVLRVGVYLPDRPPLDITANQKDYEGLSADYLDVLARGLGVRLQVNRYASQEQALAALQQGEVDLVPRINHLEAVRADLLLSAPYAYDQAVLISKFGTHWPADHPPAGTTVLFDPDWIQRERVASLFPQLQVESVHSTDEGLGRVAYGEGMVLLTDAISAQYLVERSYQQSLKQTIQRDSEGLGFSFAVQRGNTPLRTLLNSALANISPQERGVIARRWGIGANPRLGYSRLQLTPVEQQWIKDHPQIDVLANDLYSPFSFFDAEGRLRGMAADLLELINDRTGLVFRPSKITSVDAMTSRAQRDPVSIIAALTYSERREPGLMFSRPYVINPFVLVTRTQPEHSGLTGMKGRPVALVKGSAAANWLEREWPDIQQVAVDAPIETYELLAEGRVEGVIQPQLGATYLIDRFFRGRLQIDSVIGSQPALIGFATGHQNTELVSILNKALLDIRPEKFSDLANRWQNPQESQGGWSAYKSWFYKAVLGLLVVVLAILAWNRGLRRQIAERQKAQKALNDQLEFMKVLVDGTPHPIYVRDRQGLLLTCNRAYLQVMEIELEQVQGKGLIETNILAPDDAWSYKRIHRATLDSGEPSFDNFTMTVNGKTYHIYHWALPYRDSDGTMTGVIGGWIDLTEQQHLQHALHQAKDLAEAANRGKSHFLAVMSHEIRTPMSALIGVLELMRDHRSDAQLIDIAQKSASGMMELIGEILDLSKIESGKFELRSGTCHPERLVSTVIQSFASLAQQKNVALEFINQGLDTAVELDSLRFRQIASNLISNAIKFTPQGSVMVQLLIEPQGDLAHVRLSVQDTGVGMDDKQRERLFQPYTQFASNDSELQIGTGLGLAICQQLTQLMGGRLSCVSAPGQGSRFTLELDADLAPDDAPVPLDSTEHLAPLPARDILIVEDHEFNRVVLQRQLESLGMRVTCAENGLEGLRVWDREIFDYVITDCNMPQMSGDQMTRQLRSVEAREGRTATHVVGLTANAQPQEIQRCLDAGMNDCLFKPVTRSALERYLRQVEQVQQAAAPCFDISKVSDITAGDAAMTRQLLATVLRTNQEDFDAMQALYAAGDYSAMGRRSHKILGSARIIHAAPLISACEELEQACGQSIPLDALSRLHQAFAEQMQRLQNSLQEHLNGRLL
ncbi:MULTISPECIES: ATP-binding protein [unclassified Pseudomonas]|uniref:ATP-binding protein n=1 Tax=unclassified Pseudomonas TaxID=196821 RepID=UPI000C86A04B|nr:MULTISPECIES: transporter substrate-binding domain-containing protein [unclassified Pseudomonas]PMV86524.1 hybrid sensor histidine kinase/response regulator [Pseudomonas sp. GW101-1A09]PMV96324.1 hybrid sensor histidine kinase/response regulator [Pseudomonas sp. FW306-2-2C-B10A]PMV97994.1 hybrid sensor histidine kinase/response regulator [Pseudomonas sp. GW460-C8]PMW05019.1 hybrid sensor histidine kinase/response regulator [Pseudomonas sp. MPR-TSA4]PMW18061.1 hybrid sensor histidine kinase/